MPKRTYTLEPQRRVDGQGYVLCPSHAAERFAIIEITHIPAKHGRRSYRSQRIYRTYSGAGAARHAQHDINGLTGKTSERPKPGIYARSCTIAEYDEIMDRTREEGSY